MNGRDIQLLIKEMKSPSAKRAMRSFLEEVESLQRRVDELEKNTSPHAAFFRDQ